MRWLGLVAGVVAALGVSSACSSETERSETARRKAALTPTVSGPIELESSAELGVNVFATEHRLSCSSTRCIALYRATLFGEPGLFVGNVASNGIVQDVPPLRLEDAAVQNIAGKGAE